MVISSSMYKRAGGREGSKDCLLLPILHSEPLLLLGKASDR